MSDSENGIEIKGMKVPPWFASILIAFLMIISTGGILHMTANFNKLIITVDEGKTERLVIRKEIALIQKDVEILKLTNNEQERKLKDLEAMQKKRDQDIINFYEKYGHKLKED